MCWHWLCTRDIYSWLPSLHSVPFWQLLPHMAWLFFLVSLFYFSEETGQSTYGNSHQHLASLWRSFTFIPEAYRRRTLQLIMAQIAVALLQGILKVVAEEGLAIVLFPFSSPQFSQAAFNPAASLPSGLNTTKTKHRAGEYSNAAADLCSFASVLRCC